MTDLFALLGQGIKRVRERRELTQEQCAALLRQHGLTTWRRTTVSQVELGARKPSLPELLLIACALGVGLADLLSGQPAPVELADGVTLPLHALRRMLLGAPCGENPTVSASVPVADDTERRSAKRLDVDDARFAEAAACLWGRPLTQERDARLELLPARRRQGRERSAWLGHITRQLQGELQAHLTAAGTVRP